MRGAVVALGSVNADFQARLERPFDAETLVAHDFRRLGGGKAANVAYLACRLGHEAWLLGRVGDDDLADQALGPLRAAHVDVSGVSRAAGTPTGVALVLVPPSGKKRIVIANNANDAWDDHAERSACARIRAAPWRSVLVADCEVPAALVRNALATAAQRQLRTVLDPTFAARVDAAMLAGLDAITPNEFEARGLRGVSGAESDDLDDIARALVRRGVRNVCIKLEDGGCLYATAEGHEKIPAPGGVEVVDTTGAGDAFAAAFAVALLEGRSPRNAARFAVAASAVAVTAYGAQPALPGRDAIEAMMRRRGGQNRA